jgi:hypothetical protein
MNRPLRAGVVALSLVVSAVTLGAAGPKRLTLTVYSDPAGATIYQNDQVFGYAPTRLKYKVTKGFRAGKECARLIPLKVRWASGAEASIGDQTACPQNGGNQQITFVRPTGVDGREMDVLFAIQITSLMQQRAANEAAATAAAWDAIVPFRPIVPARPVHCTSQVIGRQVFTNCY